ncbi:phosphotyrosine-specific ptp2-like protein [Microbotryomycetes sp. JL221]|nr:phosphotyrosine-specific ptp2-like protein [Microbotryomycetes sp. JL221]
MAQSSSQTHDAARSTPNSPHTKSNKQPTPPSPLYRPRLSPVAVNSSSSGVAGATTSTTMSYFSGFDTMQDHKIKSQGDMHPHTSLQDSRDGSHTPAFGVHSKWAALQSGPMTSSVGPTSGFNFGQPASHGGHNPFEQNVWPPVTSRAVAHNQPDTSPPQPSSFDFQLNRATASGLGQAFDASNENRSNAMPASSLPSSSPFSNNNRPALATPSSAFPPTSPHSATPSYNVPKQQGTFKISSNRLSSAGALKHPIARGAGPAIPAGASSHVNSRFVSILPHELVDRLISSFNNSYDTPSSMASTSSHPPQQIDVLLLDMRTHTAFIQNHVPGSISICVPSTLLRRPAYGIDRVAEGLDPTDQERFNHWSTAKAIAVVDGDSTHLTEASGIASMLAKFDNAGFQGELRWVRGGWVGLSREINNRSPPDQSRLTSSGTSDADDHHDGDDRTDNSGSSQIQSFAESAAGSTSPPAGSKKHARPVLQVRDLPAAAFQQSSTSAFAHSGPAAGSFNLGGRPTGETGHGGNESRPHVGKRRKSTNEGYHNVQRSDFTSNTAGEKRVATNPFFDNIRQNTEALSLERSLENLSPVEFTSLSPEVVARLPAFLSKLVSLEPMQRAQILARQFYELEVAERERLEGTLNWHTNVQGREDEHNKAQQKFEKYGISAGVELGSLNRFKNIFPYDHSRVRLERFSNGATDYVNASHIHLSGSKKRFIASQGPLPTTFSDFWQLCDQEQVGVIVMLTNLHEGGREKCGKYWVTQPTQEWAVETDGGSQDSTEDDKRQQFDNGGGFFASTDSTLKRAQSDEASDATTLRRDILLRRRSANPVTHRPRKIRHIQYRAWPDFDLPARPEDVVELVKEVDAAQKEYMAEIGWQGEVEPPIVTHCSAGCGRTGVFILVSTILEKFRIERAAARTRAANLSPSRLHPVSDGSGMDVDGEQQPQPENSDQSSHSLLSPTTPSFPPSAGSGLATPSSLIPNTAALSLQSSPQLFPAASTNSPSPGLSFGGGSASSSSPLPSTLPIDSAASTPLKPVPAFATSDPVFAGVNEMREQRMSMVANYRQFVCVHECVLVGLRDMIEEDL